MPTGKFLDANVSEELHREWSPTKLWFFNSRGEVYQSLNPESFKHRKRMLFGNAFATREEAEAVRDRVARVARSKSLLRSMLLFLI